MWMFIVHKDSGRERSVSEGLGLRVILVDSKSHSCTEHARKREHGLAVWMVDGEGHRRVTSSFT